MISKPRKRKWLRWLLIAGAPLLAVILVVAGMLFTLPGRNLLAAVAEKLASSPGQVVDIGRIGGESLSSLDVNHVTVSDSDGPWFQLRDVTLDWSPWDLLSGRLTVESFRAKNVVIAHLPPDQAQEDDSGSASLPVSVDIRELALERIDLGQSVLGTSAAVALTGSARIDDLASGIDGKLALRRLDAPGNVEGEFLYRPSDGRLTTRLTASEPEGGLIVRSLAIEGLPSLTASIDGDGTLDDWRTDLKVDIGGDRLLEGKAGIRKQDQGHRLSYSLKARPSPLLASNIRSLFDGELVVEGAASRSGDGEIELETTRISNRRLTADLAARMSPDGALRDAKIVADLHAETAPHEVTLSDGERIAVGSGRLEVTARTSDGVLGIIGSLGAASLEAPDIASGRLNATFEAAADPRILSGTIDLDRFEITAEAQDIGRLPADFAEVVGRNVTLEARGAFRDGTVQIATANIASGLGDLALEDSVIDRERFSGRFSALLPDLSRLTPLVSQAIAGRLEIGGDAEVSFADAGTRLDVEGNTKGLVTGIAQADALLGDVVNLRGGVATSGNVVSFESLRVTGRHLSASVDGTIGGATARMSAEGQIGDLSVVSPELAGSIGFDASVDGSRENAKMSAVLSGTAITVNGKSFSNPSIRFDGSGPIDAPTGKLAIAGEFADRKLAGNGDVTVTQAGAGKVENLVLTYSEARASGSVAYVPSEGPSGALLLSLPDLSAFNDLTGVAVAGSLTADAALAREDGKVSLRAEGFAENLVYENVQIRRIDLNGRVGDIFSRPVAEGRADILDLVSDGTRLPNTRITAIAGEDTTRLTVATRVMDTDLTAGGGVLVDGQRITVSLRDASATRGGQTVTLAQPTDILVEDGRATLRNVRLSAGNGTATINGTASQTLDITASLVRFPVGLANAFVPDLGAEGEISGTIQVTGPASAPAGRYDLTATGISLAAMRQNGLAPLSGRADGRLTDGRLTVDGRITGRDGMALDLSGSLPAGSDTPLDLKAAGSVPLALADPALATRGGSISGLLRADITVTGPPAAPVVEGVFTTTDARLRDPESGIDISGISARVRMDTETVTIEQFTGSTARDGRISAGGRIGLAAGNPADVKITARNFNIENEQLVKGTLDADLALTGPLTAGPSLGGKIDISRLDITIPDALPPSVRKLDVRHKNARPAVRRQAEALRKKEKDGPSLPVSLDLRINAANRIFVRGRGIDAVLGGSVGLSGTTNDPVIDGAFRLARGRLDILDRRLDFSRGNVEFTGTADPQLDFAAGTITSAAQVSILVSGPASEPKFTFESSPELPQDEVLAQLIFNRSVSELSPLQIARLSSEIARLGGLAGGTSLLGELQNALGIDELDLSGGGASAGRYVNENVYLGVQQSGTDSGSAVIDLDITKNLKARGEFGSDGNSKVGVGVEFEY